MSWNKISKTELEPYLWVYCTEILHHVLNMFYMSQWHPSLANYIRSCFIILTTTFCTKLSLCLLLKIFCFLFISLVFTNFYARRTSSCYPHQKKKNLKWEQLELRSLHYWSLCCYLSWNKHTLINFTIVIRISQFGWKFWQSLDTNYTSSHLKMSQDDKREHSPLFEKLCLAN